MSLLMSPAEVVDTRTFARYCQQRLGTPMPLKKDWGLLGLLVKKFFDENPRASWGTLVRTVNWAQAKRRAPAHCRFIFDLVRYAFADKALPELLPDHTDFESRVLEGAIRQAMEQETDPSWRRRLAGASGEEARRNALRDWRELRRAS